MILNVLCYYLSAEWWYWMCCVITCQLEDDIECKPGYLTVIKSFVSNQQNDEWVLLEFSHLGFIGKNIAIFKHFKLTGISL